MTEIKQNYLKICEQIDGKTVTLVPVSKKKPVSDLMQVYEAGGRIFGENYVQELTDKYDEMPKDINWHMMGHLQRNKVKYIAPFVSLIQSVDSLRLLKEINKEAAKNERVIDCLLQIFIAEEESKTGMDEADLPEILTALLELENVRVIGLMGISTFTDNKETVTREFHHLKRLFDEGKQQNPHWDTLSMGMSGDWEMALTEGSTMIRVGTAIFGARKK